MSLTSEVREPATGSLAAAFRNGACAAVFLIVGLAGFSGPPGLPGAMIASADPARSAPAEPFARVYLAIRGCSSCAHCRTSIRQMVRASSKGGEARLGDDQVEVRYTAPRTIPLRDVIQSLAKNRLHDLRLVDVLFAARGAIRTSRDGSPRFFLDETGQAFPISIDRAVRRPADGTPVRLTALVECWRGKDELTLTARTIDSP
jgi:hypothetical protein